jgi:hypothetical protein
MTVDMITGDLGTGKLLFNGRVSWDSKVEALRQKLASRIQG